MRDAATAAGLGFRPAGDDDLAFLCRLYGTTRAAELASLPWSDADKAAFVRMQFAAQHAHYTRHYPNAERLIVLHDGEPIGRLYVDRWRHEHRIVDIALLPEHCGRGLGAALLGDLIAEAEAAGKAVTIHVEKHNPATRLYRRLGFVAVEDKGVYDLMCRPPPQSAVQVNTAS
jgi:ribosomal protein S18 acetylase RimI-like enzyme